MPKNPEQRQSIFRTVLLALGPVPPPAPPPPAPPPETVEVDEEGVRRLRAGEVIERVRWERLINVSIATTDEGPFAEDFFWLLGESDGSGCAIASGQAEATALLDKLSKLPRFDHRAVIAASGSTSDALFLCWDGAPGEGAACVGTSGRASAMASAIQDSARMQRHRACRLRAGQRARHPRSGSA